MKYDLYLSSRAKKQFKKFDVNIRSKLKAELMELEEEPFQKGNVLQGFAHGLRYIKILHNGVQYRQFMILQKIKRKFYLSF
jgi:mRNA-degrading endonuclease RelE of RelBE toxin-antitoxin system